MEFTSWLERPGRSPREVSESSADFGRSWATQVPFVYTTQFSSSVTPQTPEARDCLMRAWLQATMLAGLAGLFVSPIQATDEKRLIDVVARPTADSFQPHADVTVKVTFTNNAHYEVSFLTCPTPYTVNLEDKHGPVTPRKHDPPHEKDDELIPPGHLIDTPICYSSVLVAIKPGDSVPTQVPLSALYDLDVPGSYTGRITWHFPEEVQSNSFHITIGTKPQN
jgi:hypothetical protein